MHDLTTQMKKTYITQKVFLGDWWKWKTYKIYRWLKFWLFTSECENGPLALYSTQISYHIDSTLPHPHPLPKPISCLGWGIKAPFTEECSAQTEKYILLKSFLDFSN